jgi:PPP family 3-phenylpropionic acid transporter
LSPEPKDDAQRRLSLLAAALSAIGGVQVAFFPLWLGARGMSGAEIALILAACPAIRIPSHLIGTRLGDKYGDYGRLIVTYAAAGTVIFVVLGFVQGFYGLLFWVAALSFAQAPIGPLNDGLVLGEVHRRRALGRTPLNFSGVRGWGSASVLLFMLGAGPVADAIPAGELIWIMTAISCFTTVAGFFLVRGLRRAGRESRNPMRPRRRRCAVRCLSPPSSPARRSFMAVTAF